MSFRMSRKLEFEVGIICERQDLNRATDKEISAILLSFEGRGDAMRSLNRRGEVVWKLTKQFLEELTAEEREVDAECKNWD